MNCLGIDIGTSHPKAAFYSKESNTLHQLDLGECPYGQSSQEERLEAVFRAAKTAALDQCNRPPDRVVLALPASVPPGSYLHTRATELAHNIFNVTVEIIAQPVATAFSLLRHKLSDHKVAEGTRFLVYDLGARSFDASLLAIVDGQIAVVRHIVSSDILKQWGGEYIDSALRRDCYINSNYAKVGADYFKEFDDDEKRMFSRTMHSEAIRAKMHMAVYDTYTYSFGDYTLTREHFDELVRPMVDDTLTCALATAGPDFENVSAVILAGGSSKLRTVYDAWSELRTDMGLRFDIVYAPISAAASGAAVYPKASDNDADLFNYGLIRLDNGDNVGAARCFAHSQLSCAKEMLGLMYLTNRIGGRETLYNTAFELLRHAGTPYFYLILAWAAYKGGMGIPHDLAVTRRALSDGWRHPLADSLRRALDHQNVDAETIRQIYCFDPLDDFAARYDVPTLRAKYCPSGASSTPLTDSEAQSVREVTPANPELDINLYN